MIYGVHMTKCYLR